MGDSPVKIVIAEDDPEDMELIADAIILADPDAELHKFIDGLSVYEYLSARPDNDLPSLIILDYNMPRLTGAQVLKNMRTEARFELIPKVVLSTSNTPLYRYECIRNGATEYFVKPGTMRELDTLVRKLLGLRRI
jgi:DNA-binding response OmpR family regulator